MNKKILICFVFVSMALLGVILLMTSASAASAVYFNMDISNQNTTSTTSSTIITSSSALLVVNTDVNSNCKYAEDAGISYNLMSNDFDANYGTIHKITLTNLITGPFTEYIKCQDYLGNVSKELAASFMVNLPVSAQIVFANGPSLKDGKAEFTLVTSEIISDTPSLSYTTDGVGYKPVPLIGSGKNWEGYIIIPAANEHLIGSFKFQARDLEGNVGDEITSGSIFTIDTIPPNALLDIKAEGGSKGINLTWNSDEDGLTFNIYRATSPGASYSDLYKKVHGNSYIDTDVSSGKTYYYKISGVDDAGNEGSLSREVYATPSFGNTDTSVTLDLRYVGEVNNFIQSIDDTSSSINGIITIFNSKEGTEKNLFDYLKLSASIDSAKNSLASLRTEVIAYKSQALTQDELDKKLNSAQVRLNIIKTNMPESLVVSDQISLTNQLAQNDINAALLGIKPDLTSDQLDKLSKKASGYIASNELEVSGKAYNVEVDYLDGTQKQYTLVEKNVKFGPQNANSSLIEVIPKEIAQTSADLILYNTDYNILKDDPIISFSSDASKIVYFVKDNIDLKSIGKMETFIMDDNTDGNVGSSSITGFVALLPNGNAGSISLTVGVVLILILLLYLFSIKTRLKDSDRLSQLKEKMNSLKDSLSNNNTNKAFESYKDISEQYKLLTKKEKNKIYLDLHNLHEKLSAVKEQIRSNVTNKSVKMLITMFIAAIIIAASFAFAADAFQQLNKGKNEVSFDKETYASELTRMNPDIESITYFDEFLNESFGYVNIFGGIGKNFIITPNQKYEVSAKKNISLMV